MSKLTRRGFFIGCGTTMAALAGARITNLAFAAPEALSGAAAAADILVLVFLRGGVDGLNLIVPYGDANYAINRPDIRIRAPGQTRGALDLNGFFGLHPAATHLRELYTGGALAIVHAVGLTDSTRSHFDAMSMLERGTPGNTTTATGWLTRHLAAVTGIAGTDIPVIAAQSASPDSLLGYTNTAAISSLSGLEYSGAWDQIDFQRLALRTMYAGTSWLYQAGIQALDVSDRIALADLSSYTPEFGAVYPGGSFGDSLKLIAQMIKKGLGVRLATVDLGGWDTHQDQGNDGQGNFAGLVTTLSQGLHACYTDLTNYANRMTWVVMSEFGRRLAQNESDGTDHGHGGVMLVLGGNVNKGIYGQWPGLATDALDEKRDLAITTDYRRVLSEIVMRRLMNPNLSVVFPGFTGYQPLNVVKGTDAGAPQRVYLPLLKR
jgi:uncharacterized protein (DUF1501 family)